MKITFFILLILSFSCISTGSKPDVNTEKGNYKIPDTVRITFFLDGKVISKETIGKGMQSNTIQYVDWSRNTRDALLRFGEKYRNGIQILESKHKQHATDKNK